jgi:hypothetical protein
MENTTRSTEPIGTEEYIDLTPTWEATVRIYLEVWSGLSDEGRRGAQGELLRCARLADKYVSTQQEED